VTLLRAVLALVVATAGLVVATDAADGAAGPTLRLVAQDLVVAPGATASFTFTVTGAVPANTEVVVEAYGRLASPRSDFQQLIAGNLRNRDVGFVATSLNRLTPDGPGRYTVDLPTVVTPDQRVLGGNALLPDAGMYPITIELRSDNTPLAQMVTTLVRTAAADASALPSLDVALVMPLGGAVTLQADGTTTIGTDDRTRLQTVASALAASHTPVTLIPQPELVDGLARSGLPADAILRTALGTATGGREVLATPYVAMDPSAADEAGLGDELTKQLAVGEDTLSEALDGVTTDRTTWVLDGAVTDGAVSMLRDLGVRRVVLPASAVRGDGPVPTTAVGVTGSNGPLPVDVAVADPGLGRAFGPHDDPVLAAYQFAAELLAVDLDHATATSPQGVVVVPPASWQPGPTFLGAVLALLGQTTMLHPVTVDQWFREVQTAAGAPRTLAPAAPSDLSQFANGLALTRLRLAALASMLPANDPLPASLEAELRVANAVSFTSAQRQAYLDGVNNHLNQLADAVDPIPKRRVTLAGRTTELPITIHRRIDKPIKVRVRLESSKLAFPQNDVLVTLDSDTVQERVAVKARANGTFPLTVTILTPEGGLPVAQPTELTVQATTLSGFGVVLTVGALLVLATWWVRHIRRSRRQRGVEAGAEHHPSAGPPPTALPAP
jgi:hypothetical protein